jgi:hypothetical protein
MPLISWIAVTLFGVALEAVPALLRRAAMALGVGAITYTGFNLLLTFLTDQIYAKFGQLGAIPLAAQIVGTMQLDMAVTNILTAMSIKMTMNLAGGTTKKTLGFV